MTTIVAASQVVVQTPPVYEYLASRAQRMADALPPLPEDLAGWAARCAAVRQRLSTLLGLPAREPMRARTLATREAEDGQVEIEDVMFLWAGHTYVSGNVVRPRDNSRPLPTVVMPPGWVGEMNQAFYPPFLMAMARRGYLVLFIDDPHVMKREAPCAGLYGVASAAGTQVMGIQVFDVLRGLDYVLTRADVDPARIGITGLCQGAEQAWLAAALDERFKAAAPICGTTTFKEWARMPGVAGVDLGDASPYVTDVLQWTDWHEIGACIAPRPLFVASNAGDNWWPEAGFDQVVATLKYVYALHGRPENFRTLRDLRSHDMKPYMPELLPWFDEQLKTLPASETTATLPRGEPGEANFSMMRHLQQRITHRVRAMPARFDNAEDWRRYRTQMTVRLAKACDLDSLRVGTPRTIRREIERGIVKESLDVPQDAGLTLRLTLYHSRDGDARAAVILSHDGVQSDTDLIDVSEQLATAGYLVCVPAHASPVKGSPRDANNPVGYYGISSLYGAGDCVSLPPMAMRVWDDLAALALLRRRAGITPDAVAIVGLGAGGVDAAITAAVDPRLAALGAIGAITVEHWARHVAPSLGTTDRVMPYLPDITAYTELAYIYSAVAPRPLLLVDWADRPNWPQAAYNHVRAAASHVFDVTGAPHALTTEAATSPSGIDEILPWLDANV
ncbi:MAG: dienelactone hydrolase family protein [Phycisphaeraceae bacterium]